MEAKKIDLIGFGSEANKFLVRLFCSNDRTGSETGHVSLIFASKRKIFKAKRRTLPARNEPKCSP
jgi:hypothetical protein